MTDTTLLATFRMRHEAEFARATLQSAGIESVLVGDDAGGAYGGLSFTRGMRLFVLREDFERARVVLGDAGLLPEDGGRGEASDG